MEKSYEAEHSTSQRKCDKECEGIDGVLAKVQFMTSHLPTNEEDMQKQAASTHKNEVPKEIHPKPTPGAAELHNDAS